MEEIFLDAEYLAHKKMEEDAARKERVRKAQAAAKGRRR